ncbi:chorismate mutase [Blattabacterium cuenoti]|nr:chorismate mutase [Blattabacterium cuenoti]
MEKDILNKNIDRSWVDNNDQPFIISGPCSAENEKQILDTAQRLKNIQYVRIFRAGIWKPRTKPNNFEGIGQEGLEWMKKVKKKTGMLVATEVANAEHVKLCLSFDIDVLWIGARSTASPFTIQEIANALEGDRDRIVLIKNPIHPDIDLWIGALERLFMKGVRKLGVIHRGFYTYKHSQYRNTPCWDVISKFREMVPDVPIICDPSHICGNKIGLIDIMKKAFHFQYDGLMIESHCDPIHAWSDADQQVTPEHLLDMLQKTINNVEEDPKGSEINLNSLRIFIDEIDENLIFLLSERMHIAKKLGSIKKSSDIDTLQPDRWKSVMDKSMNLGRSLGLSEKFLEGIFQLLHQASINVQNTIRE